MGVNPPGAASMVHHGMMPTPMASSLEFDPAQVLRAQEDPISRGLVELQKQQQQLHQPASTKKQPQAGMMFSHNLISPCASTTELPVVPSSSVGAVEQHHTPMPRPSQQQHAYYAFSPRKLTQWSVDTLVNRLRGVNSRKGIVYRSIPRKLSQTERTKQAVFKLDAYGMYKKDPEKLLREVRASTPPVIVGQKASLRARNKRELRVMTRRSFAANGAPGCAGFSSGILSADYGNALSPNDDGYGGFDKNNAVGRETRTATAGRRAEEASKMVTRRISTIRGQNSFTPYPSGSGSSSSRSGSKVVKSFGSGEGGRAGAGGNGNGAGGRVNENGVSSPRVTNTVPKERSSKDTGTPFPILPEAVKSFSSLPTGEESYVVTWSKNSPIPIDENTEGFSELLEAEVEVCKTLRLPPVQYLVVKNTLLSGRAHHGTFKKREAQSWCRIDVNKTGKIFDWYISLGWLAAPAPGRRV